MRKKNPFFMSGWIEKSVPRDHRLSAHSKPLDANQ